ncbi:MAG: CBS domain-containing protein [Nitrososphaeria archaeon]
MGKVDLGKEYPSVLDRAYIQYKRHQKIDEIMSRNIVSTTPKSTMDEAAKVMGERHVGSLIVIKYETPVGIVTERDLLSNVMARGLDLKEVIVEKVMSYPLITICPTISIKEAAQTMIKKKGRLAVFECGKLVGIVTASDLIRSLPESPETMLKVDDFMTKGVVEYDEGTILTDIIKTMGDRRIGSVIVTSKGSPKGIFTERDLLTTILSKGRPTDISVGTVSSSPLITAPCGISAHQAAKMMTSRHIRRLPLTKDTKIVGIITARDLVEAYAK